MFDTPISFETQGMPDGIAQGLEFFAILDSRVVRPFLLKRGPNLAHSQETFILENSKEQGGVWLSWRHGYSGDPSRKRLL